MKKHTQTESYIAPPSEKALFTFHYINSLSILSTNPLTLQIIFRNSGEDGNGVLLGDCSPVVRFWSLEDSVCREDVEELMSSERAEENIKVEVEPGNLGLVITTADKKEYVVDSEVIWEESHALEEK